MLTVHRCFWRVGVLVGVRSDNESCAPTAHRDLVRTDVNTEGYRALRQYEKLGKAFQKQVGSKPSAASQCLYREILV